MSDFTDGLPIKRQLIDQVDKIFQARSPSGQSFELTLNAVEDHVSTDLHENFSVFFSGPIDMPKEQAVYSLENEIMVSFDVFLVPVGIDSEKLRLEAVFNHIREHSPQK